MKPLKMRDLPGWEEACKHAAVRLQIIDWVLIRFRIGNELKTVGARPAPAGLDHVTPLLVRSMVAEVNRDKWEKRQRAKLEATRQSRSRGRLLVESALAAPPAVGGGDPCLDPQGGGNTA